MSAPVDSGNQIAFDLTDIVAVTKEILERYGYLLTGDPGEDDITPADLVVATVYPTYLDTGWDLWIKRFELAGVLPTPELVVPVPDEPFDGPLDAFRTFVQENIIAQVEWLLDIAGTFVDMGRAHERGIQFGRVILDAFTLRLAGREMEEHLAASCSATQHHARLFLEPVQLAA